MAPTLLIAVLAIANPAESKADSRTVDTLLAASTVMLIAVDVALAIDNVPGNTFSERIRVHSRTSSFIPWAAGAIAGHLFLPTRLKIPPAVKALGLVGTGVSAIIYGLVAKKPLTIAERGVLFSIGFASGSLLWGF